MFTAPTALARSWSALARFAVALAVMSLLLPGFGVAESAPSDPLHTHEGPRRVAIDATHHSQPTHLDSSSIRVEWSCAVCLTQNRKGERSQPVAQSAHRLPPATYSAAVPLTVPIRRQTRLDSSRAPPRGL